VFNGPNPETGEDLVVIDEAPEGVLPRDLPPQPAVFAPDYLPEEIGEIATKLRQRAGLPKEPTGMVADLKQQAKRSTRKVASRKKAQTR
jgi:Mn-containing catalase